MGENGGNLGGNGGNLGGNGGNLGENGGNLGGNGGNLGGNGGNLGENGGKSVNMVLSVLSHLSKFTIIWVWYEKYVDWYSDAYIF